MAVKDTSIPIQKGILVAFEGIDGSGKSTQIQLLADELSGRGYNVVTTREPTDGPIGLKIRELYHSREEVSKEEELDLFLEDRKQHVEKVIKPALKAGRIVLTDRYYFSTAAYQGAAGLDPEDIIKKNELFAPIPDLVLILKTRPELGINRIQTLRGQKLNAFEQETELQKVAGVFDKLDRGYVKHIDGSESIDKVKKTIFQHIEELLGRKNRSSA